MSASSWLLDSETPFCATNIGGHALTIGNYGGGINPPATFFLAFHGKRCDSSDGEGLYIGLKTVDSTGDWDQLLISADTSVMPIAPISIITYYITNQYFPYLIAYCKGSDAETVGTPYMVTVDSSGYHLIRKIVSKGNINCESGKKLTLSKLDNVAGGRDTYYLSFPRTSASGAFINVLSNSNGALKATRWYRTRYDLPWVTNSIEYGMAPFIDELQSSATLLFMYSNETSGFFEISTSKGYF